MGTVSGFGEKLDSIEQGRGNPARVQGVVQN
ncbi:hypothetical protein SCOR_35625 [Sulfidibacter corallicola]